MIYQHIINTLTIYRSLYPIPYCTFAMGNIARLNINYMSEKVETLVFPDNGNKSNDLLLASAMNGGMGGFGGQWMWGWFLGMMMRNGFAWNGDNNNNGQVEATKDLLMSAINGNNTALQGLANQFNCSIGQVQSALCNIASQIQNIGAQVGMSVPQVINAIQAGNMSLAQQISECCCGVRDAITRQGYENQLAVCGQTNALNSTMERNTQGLKDSTNAGFLSILQELRNMQTEGLRDKLEAKNTEIATLKAQINNEHQTQAIGQMFAQSYAQTAELRAEIEKVKCALPPTTVVPNPQVATIPTCVAYQWGLGGFPNGNFYL